ncbi:hypothetical protein QBC47DRAFT_405573 [Echria macrotheca]|uniref:Uncharacterized protein n=1 Tax=Echria macrotheca TaxID=438768 RepID=A0AAJ0B8X4_9PEZI|nr:hypothetical protein QBC47DRAFT_405573 [Echria macrotheca]
MSGHQTSEGLPPWVRFDIKDNKSSNSSTQNIITALIIPSSCHLEKAHGLAGPACKKPFQPQSSPPLLAANVTDQVAELLASIIPSAQMPKDPPKVPSPRERAPNGSDSPRRNVSSRPPEVAGEYDHLFSVLQPFRNEYAEAVARHKHGIWLQLDQRIRDSIKSWASSRESKMFPVHVCDERRLILEITTIVEPYIERAPSVAQLVHLCHTNHRKKTEQPRILILDLISQIDRRRRRSGEPSLASLAALENVSDNNIDGLWGVFEECVVGAGIEKLFIFLERVDVLCSSCFMTDEGKRQLKCFLRKLLSLLSRKDIIVKIMVTSLDPAVARFFRDLPMGLKYFEAGTKSSS